MRFKIGAIVIAVAAVVIAQQPPQGQGQGQGQPGRGGRGGGRGTPVSALEESGFRPIFDGTMKGWDGDPDFWKVNDGVLTGETTADHQPKQNIFCIWRGGQ